MTDDGKDDGKRDGSDDGKAVETMRRAGVAPESMTNAALDWVGSSGRHRSRPPGGRNLRSGGIHRGRRSRASDPRELAPASDSASFWRYLALVCGAGAMVLVAEFFSALRHHQRWDGPYLAVVTLLLVAELRPLVKSDKRDPAGLTTSEAFVFALLLHWGLSLALLAMVVAMVVADAVRGRRPWRTAFNIAQYALAYGAASLVLIASSVDLRDHRSESIGAHDLPAIAAAAVAFFLVNDLLVAGAVARHQRVTWKSVLLEGPGYRIVSTAALLCLSPLLVVVAERSSGFLPLLLVPLYAVGQAAALAQERERQALHDPLTGLANRTQLLERARPALAAASGECPPVALLMVDLDDFKAVNDTHGHLAGDELLRLVGARLAGAVRPGDVVARFGGDEFAVLLCDLSADVPADVVDVSDTGDAPEAVSPEAVADQVAARIRLALREPYQLGDLAVTVGASVGTAVAPKQGGDVDALLHAADVAMYRVKADRRTPVTTVDVSSPVIHLNNSREGEPSMSSAGVGGSAESAGSG